MKLSRALIAALIASVGMNLYQWHASSEREEFVSKLTLTRNAYFGARPTNTLLITEEGVRAAQRRTGSLVPKPQTHEEWIAYCSQQDSAECRFLERHGPPISELEYLRACDAYKPKSSDCEFLSDHISDGAGISK